MVMKMELVLEMAMEMGMAMASVDLGVDLAQGLVLQFSKSGQRVSREDWLSVWLMEKSVKSRKNLVEA